MDILLGTVWNFRTPVEISGTERKFPVLAEISDPGRIFSTRATENSDGEAEAHWKAHRRRFQPPFGMEFVFKSS